MADRKVLIGDITGGMIRHEQGDWDGGADRVADPAGRILALQSEVTAASHGITGVVDAFTDLPDAQTLPLGTIFIVRQDTGAPDGNGLYWIQGTPKAWVYFDGLNLQAASEVPYADQSDDGTGASAWDGTPPVNMGEAMDRIAGALARHLGTGKP